MCRFTTSTSSQPNMTFFEAFKKLKRLKPTEPSFGAVGFVFLAVTCFLCCFFYLDYRLVTKGFRVREHTQTQTQGLLWFNGTVERKMGAFEGCDLFDGNWVWDDKYPLYQSRDCPFLDLGFRCSENGRPDVFYTKWRWQPTHCNLPRFDAKAMLEKLRNRRLVYVGDSIGRNQWESLLCMLSSAVPDKNSIYEVNGSPITKHNGFLVFKFKDYNCTVEYFRSPFLVLQSRPPPNAPVNATMTLKLDRMDWTSPQWKDADVLVFNTGHWWNYGKTVRGGCYFQEGEEVKVNMSIENAYRRSIDTVFKWIQKEVNKNKTQIFFRTFAPVHFRGGDWKTGGNCHMETLPELGSPMLPSQTWTQFSIVDEMLSDHSNKSQVMGIDVLNVTHLTSWRKDGHSSVYYLSPKPAPLHRQDCSHWCLPGVPDVWNELLYALFLRREAAAVQHWNSTADRKSRVVNKAP